MKTVKLTHIFITTTIIFLISTIFYYYKFTRTYEIVVECAFGYSECITMLKDKNEYYNPQY